MPFSENISELYLEFVKNISDAFNSIEFCELWKIAFRKKYGIYWFHCVLVFLDREHFLLFKG